MIQPVVKKEFIDSMKLIDPGLFLVWNSTLERFQVFHKDFRTGLTRILNTIEDDDGNYIPCDNRTLNFLRDVVAWDVLKKFPEPKDMMNEIRKRKKQKANQEFKDREDYRKEWNKAHRKYWKAAFENLKRGILTTPQKTKIKTISTPGFSPGAGTLILPTNFYD
jgi:uncharacterized protein YnzC (UPF0291/DUF896 family)